MYELDRDQPPTPLPHLLHSNGEEQCNWATIETKNIYIIFVLCYRRLHTGNSLPTYAFTGHIDILDFLHRDKGVLYEAHIHFPCGGFSISSKN